MYSKEEQTEGKYHLPVCPRCKKPGYFYRRKRKKPEFRCRNCNNEFENPIMKEYKPYISSTRRNRYNITLVFQYGSNCFRREMNSPSRLQGQARFVGIAKTVENYKLSFDEIYGKKRGGAVANIVKSESNYVWGVLYEVPIELMCRETAPSGIRSFDAIEDEGGNYRRHWLPVYSRDRKLRIALTYIANNPKKPRKKASFDYVKLIIEGLKENNIPMEYIEEVKKIVKEHSPRLWNKIKDL